MLPPPSFPIPQANLYSLPADQQAQALGQIYIQAAAAFSTVVDRNATLIDWITSETCHGW